MTGPVTLPTLLSFILGATVDVMLLAYGARRLLAEYAQQIKACEKAIAELIEDEAQAAADVRVDVGFAGEQMARGAVERIGELGRRGEAARAGAQAEIGGLEFQYDGTADARRLAARGRCPSR